MKPSIYFTTDYAAMGENSYDPLWECVLCIDFLKASKFYDVIAHSCRLDFATLRTKKSLVGTSSTVPCLLPRPTARYQAIIKEHIPSPMHISI